MGGAPRGVVDAWPAPAVFHGGGLEAARRRFACAPLPWIDLSTGINPVPYPVGRIAGDAWHRLPETGALDDLERAAAAAYGAANATVCVAAPGTQALIQWLPHVLPARRVAILGFGYEEHPAAWRAVGAHVSIVADLHRLAEADLAVVVNPNNPDGRLVRPEPLRDLGRAMAAKGGTLIVDEAFMDVLDPALSLIPVLPPEGAVVLRSFGKAYGLAGLRLGFAVTHPALAQRLRAVLGPWAVSGPAIALAGAALENPGWRRDAVERLVADMARLDAMLTGAGFALAGGTPLFRLTTHDAASDWFERFGRAGILVRPFATRSTWLRFGLPGDATAWSRLQEVLRG